MVLASEVSENPYLDGINKALAVPTGKLRLFGKPTCRKNRRMGVALATGETTGQARTRGAKACAAAVTVSAAPTGA